MLAPVSTLHPAPTQGQAHRTPQREVLKSGNSGQVGGSFLESTWDGSQFPLHRLLQTQFAARGDDGQVIVHVVADEVADALEAVVLCPDLGGGKEEGPFR